MADARFAFAIETAPARGSGQDRARVIATGDQLVVVLADGAGGTGNGALAAELIVDAVGAVASAAFNASMLLAQLDREVAQIGQSTAVLLSVTREGIRGASVGDSEAWLVRASNAIELSAGQNRKPLIGGGCVPTVFDAAALGDGTLVVGSDGLFRYAKRDDIIRIAAGADLDVAARALIDCVRLPTGAVQDDVAVVLVRAR